MDTSVFEEIGMTNAEIKIYLALLGLGESSAGPILDKTGLQNSVVHLTLHRLVEKGHVSFVKKGKIRYYRAADPEVILDIIEEKKSRFKSLIPELKLRQKTKERQEAEVYSGFAGFKAMLYELIKDGKKGDEYLYFAFYPKNFDDYENVFDFYKEFEKDRKKKGIVLKGIAPTVLKPKYNGRDLKSVIFADLPLPLNTLIIFNDKICFTPWNEDEEVSFMIHSKPLAESYRNYFYSIWDKHKK
jgi:HTH-type transcriptional regulator, sugar sensing transcriptional regulator